ncbi:hypothetical protein QYM36_003884 [Artemia franciscana]|uniref:Uncharacterized protein n=1 Tax=Artemia franciscana TaxID=6661 RepID=A0AA88I8B5_ARTSF|nr:hypothetical protein QYM36_003884 [Artemia franciscana]
MDSLAIWAKTILRFCVKNMGEMFKDMSSCHLFKDISIFTMSLEKQLEHLRAVLERLRRYGATIGLDKAMIAVEVVQYLDDTVGSAPLEP